MAWLLAHMWMALAAVGLFGLIFGWAIRGILVVGKLRTARVDRDVAKTELEQARAEIEGLYAAQRNVATGATDPHLKAELNVREKRMTELSAELARSKAELEALKAGAGRGTATAAPAAARPTVAGQPEEPTLLWRNRHLEGRVRHLEAALHEQASATQGASPAAISAADAATATVAAVAQEVDTTEIDKLKWQGDFLKQRVAALEAELASEPVAAVIAETQPENDANEELARLRWRNRFLEGRVAYFEGDTASGVEPVEDPAGDAAEQDSGALISATDSILHELEEADAAADAEERDAAAEEDDFEDEYEDDDSELDEDDEDEDEVDHDDDVDEDDAVEDDDIEDDVEEGDESDEEDSDEDSEEDTEDDEDGDDEDDDDALSEDDTLEDDDEAFEDEDFDEDESEDDASDSDDDALVDEDPVAAERPIALEKPVAGAPDDLTIIGGIGPKIQEVLNELGIYHYDQIAAWTPENIAWIDDRLNFSGRIAREGWVEQAAILSGDVADE
ncbi:hypothetical protein [Hyphomonas sp.]|uniref:hypothetical protein n=1 Tax=Hyphomonas sp. TaxID=87 RepID=UPI003F6EC3E1